MDCKKSASLLAQQISALLHSIAQEAYAQPLDIFNGSTLGQHFRHIFDFYDCLLRGAADCEVDYAARQREVRIEQDRIYAAACFDGLNARLESLRDEDALQIRADFHPQFQDARSWAASSVGRELMYAYDHAIHHLAMIKIGLRDAMPGLEIDETLGVAPSTLQYRAKHQSP